jgi:hypothetical protein
VRPIVGRLEPRVGSRKATWPPLHQACSFCDMASVWSLYFSYYKFSYILLNNLIKSYVHPFNTETEGTTSFFKKKNIELALTISVYNFFGDRFLFPWSSRSSGLLPPGCNDCLFSVANLSIVAGAVTTGEIRSCKTSHREKIQGKEKG